MLLEPYLQDMCNKNGSDLFVTAGRPISAKINGELVPLDHDNLTADRCRELAIDSMTDRLEHEFLATNECNYAVAIPKVGRFRCSAFIQRESVGMVIRRINTEIPDVDDLGLPNVLKEVIMAKRGLFLYVGATGTGKSTALAALLGYRNRNSRGHILTIEDPIEFVHDHEKSIVNQREVGTDTESFEAALKSSLRQAPDVIMIGEIRSREIMEYALSFAETGHLCVATLHANNANQAIDRIMHLVPKDMKEKLLFDLSLNLRAIVAQQLVPTKDGEGRVAAIEVMLNSPLIADMIARGDIGGIKEVMDKSKEQGMITFDGALFELYQQGRINFSDALHHADSPNDLRLKIKLKSNETRSTGFLDGVTVDLGDDV
ncbi:PilT/PilU family type 4a pilus ATPase [Catenovulum sp. SM1970]|uniref:PilT/PilU family type 4a pilus ATPase n=1 Tax=Marinifaba aquimaris TaxID=2741323 RepID=UPI001572D43D|nr:PilT/PilU family type 4a pilus ATPase [Marinifaba aquimaris]NTS78081.1 PilT/PilU family type 4a pilus ATPase [Marinifaba aquimaris]